MSVYQPAEDSYLLQSVLKKYVKNKSVLDVGSGSGILAESAINYGAKSILAIDINPESIKIIKSKKIPCVKSNLFSKIKTSRKFDMIIFNPPYLPEDKKEPKPSALATTGGKHGDEIIIRFLKQVKYHLNKNGKILLTLSSLTPRKKIINLLIKLKLNCKRIAEKKLFFETLEVWEIHHNK